MRATSAHSSIQLLFYCLFGTLLLLSRGQEAFAQSPSGSFMYDKRIHDFGRIYERKGTVRHTFTFKNTSSKPIVVDRINVGCSCVEADFPKQPVPAGGKAYITVSFNPSGRPGKFSKEVVVMLNGYQEYVRVWIKGEVIADISRHQSGTDGLHLFENGQQGQSSHRREIKACARQPFTANARAYFAGTRRSQKDRSHLQSGEKLFLQ